MVAQQLYWSLLVGVLGLAAWLTLRWLTDAKRPGGLKPFSAMPAPPQRFLTGNLQEFVAGERLQVHLVLNRWAEQLGPVFRFCILGRWKVVVTDPALLPAIIGRPGLPKSLMYQQFRSLASAKDDMLFTRLHANDPHWKGSRKTLARAFSADEIRKKFGATVDATLALAAQLAALPPGATVETQDAMKRVTLDVTLTAGFGLPSDAVALFGRPVPFLQLLHFAQVESSKRVSNPLTRLQYQLLPFLPPVRESRRRHAALYRLYADMCDRLEARGPVAEDDTSMWGCLRRIEDPGTGAPLSRAALIPEVAGIVIGALDTTSATCAITLGLIAGHPEVQARLAAELDAQGLLATSGNPAPRRPEYNDLAKLPYLDATLRESLRMLPVSAVGMQRTTQAAVTDLGGYAVPAKTDVLTYGLHHSRKYWDAPEAFRPERWLASAPASGPGPQPDAISAPAAPGKAAAGGAAQDAASVKGTKWMSAAAGELDGRRAAFLPFSGGPVDCLGQRLAMMEAPTILAILLGRFEVELDAGMCGVQGMLARQMNTFIITIDQGLHIKFTPRSGWRPESLRSEE